jgi:hypothetical protein
MRSEDALIGRARGHIPRRPAIGGQPLVGPPQDEPVPWPWTTTAVSGLAVAANVKQIATSLPEGDLRSQLEAESARSIDDILDHWCASHSCWPWPGPPPWAIVIAAEVAALADSHQAGFLRTELLRIAAQALLRPFGRRLN